MTNCGLIFFSLSASFVPSIPAQNIRLEKEGRREREFAKVEPMQEQLLGIRVEAGCWRSGQRPGEGAELPRTKNKLLF